MKNIPQFEDFVNESAASKKDHEVAVKLVTKLIKGNPSKFKHLQTELPSNYGTEDVENLLESFEFVNEDATTAILMLQAAMVGGQIAMLANKLDFHPIEDLKDWWRVHQRDKAVQSIISKLKDDQDVIEFLQLPKAKQEGQWKKLISPKLTADELKYINSISRNRVKTGKI